MESTVLLAAIRRIAFDVTPTAGDALRRIRDLLREHDESSATP